MAGLVADLSQTLCTHYVSIHVNDLMDYLNLHNDIVTAISKGNCSKRVEDAKDSVCACVTIQVVHCAGLLASVGCNPDCDGGIADRHDGGQ